MLNKIAYIRIIYTLLVGVIFLLPFTVTAKESVPEQYCTSQDNFKEADDLIEKRTVSQLNNDKNQFNTISETLKDIGVEEISIAELRKITSTSKAESENENTSNNSPKKNFWNF